MDQSTITRLVSDAEHANSLPEVKRCVENLTLAFALLSAELRDLKATKPPATTATALLNFQDKTKNRVRR
jgi:hypothetical protein